MGDYLPDLANTQDPFLRLVHDLHISISILRSVAASEHPATDSHADVVRRFNQVISNWQFLRDGLQDMRKRLEWLIDDHLVEYVQWVESRVSILWRGVAAIAEEVRSVLRLYHYCVRMHPADQRWPLPTVPLHQIHAARQITLEADTNLTHGLEPSEQRRATISAYRLADFDSLMQDDERLEVLSRYLFGDRDCAIVLMSQAWTDIFRSQIG